MENKLILKGMRLYGFHGVEQAERTIGTYFNIDVEITTNFLKAMADDNISGTVNYADIYETIRQQMKEPAKLMEFVARRIVQALFEEYPLIEHVRLRILKENPPIPSLQCQGCGCEVACSRDELL